MSDKDNWNSKKKTRNSSATCEATLFKFVEYAIRMLEFEAPRNVRHRNHTETIGLNSIQEELEELNSNVEDDIYKAVKEQINIQEKEQNSRNNSTTKGKTSKNSKNSAMTLDSNKLKSIDKMPRIISLEKKRYASMPIKNRKSGLFQQSYNDKCFNTKSIQNVTKAERIQSMTKLQDKQILQICDELRKTIMRESRVASNFKDNSRRKGEKLLNRHCDENVQLSFREKIQLFDKFTKDQIDQASAKKHKGEERNHIQNMKHSQTFSMSSSTQVVTCKACSTFPRAKIQQQENLKSFSRTLPRQLKLTEEKVAKPDIKEQLLYEVEFVEVAQCKNALIPVKMRIKRFDLGRPVAAVQCQRENDISPNTSVKALIAAFEERCKD